MVIKMARAVVSGDIVEIRSPIVERDVKSRLDHVTN